MRLTGVLKICVKLNQSFAQEKEGVLPLESSNDYLKGFNPKRGAFQNPLCLN
jgi:hypothetical protein